VNSFEIAILRMLIKMQKPVSIPYLVEGFPNNSEDFVLWAIDNLLKSGFISYPYSEEKDHLIYKKEKRKEILKIIDPLPELETETGKLFSIPKQQVNRHQIQPISTTDIKTSSNNKRRYYMLRQQQTAKIASGISILAVGIVIIFGNATSTSSDYRHFGLLGVHYHHNNYYPFYSVGLYAKSSTNDTFYNPQYLKTEDTTPGNSILLYLSGNLLNKCNV
jgi:hypothetical protein